MRILIAPGAFKHSLSAIQAAHCIRAGLERSGLGASLELLPIADGGNCFLEAFLQRGARRVEVTVEDALGTPRLAAFGLLADGTAVIEMAQASGLEGLPRLDPLRASTFGTGQLMQSAWELGARRFLIGLGGSATTDGGMGCLRALGVRFLDAPGQDTADIARVARVVDSAVRKWREAEVVVACDVDNPVVGPRGAAAVFAPQKGASEQDVVLLESGLRHFFGVIGSALTGQALPAGQTKAWPVAKQPQASRSEVLSLPGGGAAGGLAAGLVAVLGGRMVSGIDLLLDECGFDRSVQQADLVVTGEGQLDEQTLGGKGPQGVARRALAAGVPTVALVGSLRADQRLLREAGFAAAMPITLGPMTVAEALERADELLEKAALRLGYLLRLGVQVGRS